MVIGVLVSHALGFELQSWPIILVAVAIVFYNLFFALIFSRYEKSLESEPQLDRFFTILQVLTDYTAVFLVLYYTGGASSPLAFFLDRKAHV